MADFFDGRKSRNIRQSGKKEQPDICVSGPVFVRLIVSGPPQASTLSVTPKSLGSSSFCATGRERDKERGGGRGREGEREKRGGERGRAGFWVGGW